MAPLYAPLASCPAQLGPLLERTTQRPAIGRGSPVGVGRLGMGPMVDDRHCWRCCFMEMSMSIALNAVGNVVNADDDVDGDDHADGGSS